MKRLLLWLWREIHFPFALRYLFLWVFNQKFLIGVDALIVNENQEVLLFKHSYRKDIPWGLPGGWLKKGENPVEAVEREIQEESGFRVRIIKPLVIDTSEKYSRVDIVYLGELEGETRFVSSDEVVEAGFFPVDEMPKIIYHQEEIIRDALSQMKC